MSDELNEIGGGTGDTITEFSTYEEYLDSQITPIDLYYLEDKELARQLVELGYRGSGEPLKREEFESRKKAAENFRLSKRLATKVLASHGKDLTGYPFLQALAEREEANRSGKLTSIIFIRTRNPKGQEISGYIDYAHRLKTESFEPYFSRTRTLYPRPSDMSFYNWETQTCTSNGTPNFQVIADDGNGLLFKNKRDRKIINVDPKDRCTRFADKYVECDRVVVFLDMVLHKPQVYRHLLFNRISYDERGINPALMKLGILLVLFEVYVKWVRLEMLQNRSPPLMWLFAAGNEPADDRVDAQLILQYLYVLALCAAEFIAWHAGIRFALSLLMKQPSRPGELSWYGVWSMENGECDQLQATLYNRVSMALILSSFGRLLPILMVIWDYDQLQRHAGLFGLMVVTSNAEALSVFVPTTFVQAILLLVFGHAAKIAAQVVWKTVLDQNLPVLVF